MVAKPLTYAARTARRSSNVGDFARRLVDHVHALTIWRVKPSARAGKCLERRALQTGE